MLVLSRDLSQSIVIGDNIVVTVLEIGQRQVRIGIRAPDDVNIVREELLDRSDEYTYRSGFRQRK